MNTTNQPTAVSSNPRRIILASAYRRERRSASRQERALKTIRKIGRFDDDGMLHHRHVRRSSSAKEAMDDYLDNKNIPNPKLNPPRGKHEVSNSADGMAPLSSLSSPIFSG